ncbi:MAG TPA: amidohydrolase family protein [Candidatus Hydrogenedentes bacterium]|nr:amidohydrolase family protein [Candidatus Hydrogenedentota bacterium]
MDETIVVRGRFPGETRASDIFLRNGVVTAVRRAGTTSPDIGSPEAWLGPVLFDMQVNGVAGITLQGGSVTPEDVAGITEYLAQWGVARWMPTLVTAPQDLLEHGCQVIAMAMKMPDVARAVPGIHIEGPYISPEDGPRGAHPKAHVRSPSLTEFNRWMKAAEGHIRCVTLAPEAPGAAPFIRAITKRGVLAALGHHRADTEQIARAVEAGAGLSTHLGNGSASQMHRHQNPLWPQLAEDRLFASLIADLHHLPAPALKTFVRAKRPEHIVLVSDCVHLAGMKPGAYSIFDAQVEVKPSGKICLKGTDLFAGSGLMLIQGVVNAWRTTDLTLSEAFACASSIPLHLFGLKPPPMAVKGKKANLLVFEVDSKDKVRLQAVFIQGQPIPPL